MTAEQFIQIVRTGSDKLRVDKIVLNDGKTIYQGKGTLHITPEELKLHMALEPGPSPEMKQTGVYTKSDRWNIEGIIEDVLPFRCGNVIGCDYNTYSDWEHRLVTLKFNLNPIDLIPTGADRLTSAEMDQIKAELMKKHNPGGQVNTSGQENTALPPTRPTVQFVALLKDYPLQTLICEGTQVIEKNPYFGERQSGRLDTLRGEVSGFDYAFIKLRDNEDVAVHINSKPDYTSPNPESDWNTFYSIMTALAFIQGVHAWPYRIGYWRDGKKITDKITPPRRLSKTMHVPFRQVKFNFQEVMRLAVNFLGADGKLNCEVSNILFLFREAADYESVHGDVTLIAVCVLFESLVNQMFTELQLADKFLAQSEETKSFKAAKIEVFEFIKKQADLQRSGFARFLGIVNNTQPFTMRERLHAVSDHLGLQWEGKMETVFKTWQKVRDPLVHGKGRTGQTEEESKNMMIADSIIAGAVNVLFLKLIGYSGVASTSAFEGKHENI
jgi:hypothetical protein